MTLKQLLKEEFDLFCRKKWLQEIEKAIKRRNKYAELYHREVYVIDALVEKYNNIYSDCKIKLTEREGNNT